MTSYVVDASVVAKWFVPERLSEECARLLDGGYDLASPDLLWPELGSVLWKKARLGELSELESLRILRTLDRFPVTFYPSRFVCEGAFEIALRTGRSFYDGVYVALAVALDCQLVTADERLVRGLTGGPLAGYVVSAAEVAEA